MDAVHGRDINVGGRWPRRYWMSAWRTDSFEVASVSSGRLVYRNMRETATNLDDFLSASLTSPSHGGRGDQSLDNA